MESSHSQAHSRARRGLAVGLAVAAVLVVVDQVTKAYVEATLVPGEFVPWLSDTIGWQLVRNDGAAFGMPLPAWVFPVVTVVVTVVVVRSLPMLGRMTPVVGYGLLLGGALGNVVDRVVRPGDPGDPPWLHGHVVDFVAWGTFPRFNVADSAITVGLALLILDMLVASRGRAPLHEPMMVDLGGQGGASPTVRVIPSVGQGSGPDDGRAVLDPVDDDLPTTTT